jgi:hypothetical protein
MESILAAAVELESEAQRRDFVARACAGDAVLQRLVEELLANFRVRGSPMTESAVLRRHQVCQQRRIS